MKAPRHHNKSLNTNNTKHLAHVYQDLINSSCYVDVRIFQIEAIILNDIIH